MSPAKPTGGQARPLPLDFLTIPDYAKMVAASIDRDVERERERAKESDQTALLSPMIGMLRRAANQIGRYADRPEPAGDEPT